MNLLKEGDRVTHINVDSGIAFSMRNAGASYGTVRRLSGPDNFIVEWFDKTTKQLINSGYNQRGLNQYWRLKPCVVEWENVDAKLP